MPLLPLLGGRLGSRLVSPLVSRPVSPLGKSDRSFRERARAVGQRLERLYPRLVEFAASQTAIPSAVEWMLDNHFVLRRAAREVREGIGRGFERRLPFAPIHVPGQRRPGQRRRIEIEAAAILDQADGLLDRASLVRELERFGLEPNASLAELWVVPLVLRLLLLERIALDAPTVIEAAEAAPIGAEQRVAHAVRSLLWVEKTDWARLIEQVSLVHRTLLEDPSGDYPNMDFETRDRYRRAIETVARQRDESELEVARRATELARAAAGADPRRHHVGFYLVDDGRVQLGERVQRLDASAQHRRRTRAYLGAIISATLVQVLALLGLLLAAGAGWRAGIAALLAVIPAWTVSVSVLHGWLGLLVAPRPLAKLAVSQVPASCRTLLVVPGLLTHRSDVDALLDRIEDHYLATRDPNIELALLTDFADAETAETPSDAALLDRARAGIRGLNARHGPGDGRFHLLHRRRVWSPKQRRWMGWERKRGKLDELNRWLRGATDTTYAVHERPDGVVGGSVVADARFEFVLTLDADTILPIGAAQRLIGTLAHPLNVARSDAEGRTVSGYTVLQPRVDLTPTSRPTWFARAFGGDGAFDIYSRAVSDVYQDLFGEGVFVGKGLYAVDAFQASVHGRVPSDRVLSHDLLEGVHGRAGLVTDVVVYEDYPPHYLAYIRRMHRWIRGDWQLLAWLRRTVPTAEGPRRSRLRNRLSLISRWKILDNLRRGLLLPSLVALVAFGWLALPGPAWAWTLGVALVLAAPLWTASIPRAARTLVGRPGQRPTQSDGEAVRGDRWDRWVGQVWALGRFGLGVSVMLHEALESIDAIVRALVRTHLTGRNQLEWLPAAVTGRGSASAEAVRRVVGPSAVLALVLAVMLAWLRPVALLGAAPLLLAWVVAPGLVRWSARPIAFAPGSRPTSGLSSPTRGTNAAAAPYTVDRAALRRLARRTWGFFERVVGPGDHWLPPDHLQDHPNFAIAHRTSPTNVAMALLSTIAAHELGYFDLLELVIRLRNTMESLGQLPRHRGHFYNWCDTTTLTPLEPRYVSTVDSGNLAMALLIVEQSCAELADSARPFERRCEGLCDSLDVFADELDRWKLSEFAGTPAKLSEFAGDPTISGRTSAVAGIQRRVAVMRAALAGVRGPADWPRALEELDDARFVALDRELLRLLESGVESGHEGGVEGGHESGHDPHADAGPDGSPSAFDQLRSWAQQIHRDIQNLRNELAVQLPWLGLIAAIPSPIPEALVPTLTGLRAELGRLPSLAEVERASARILGEVAAGLALPELPAAWRDWLEQLEAALRAGRDYALALRERMRELGDRAAVLVADMDFGFLYDPERELMFIGYDASAERYDEHHYDLLASEARIASLLAIAKAEVPARHWAKLGRPIGRFGGARGLLSWSGTMFEYLMPPLLLDEGEGSLLDVSAHAAVRAQIEFGRRNAIPWGVSESGYARLDSHRNYQYRAFGVAATGFRRELERDLVIAPYASVIALQYAPAEVEANLAQIVALGGLGPLGLYEALDFTRARLELGQRHAVVRSYMAHHQGMIMLALHAQVVRGRRGPDDSVDQSVEPGLVARAHRHPLVRCVELMLRERPPSRLVPIERPQPVAGAAPIRARPPRIEPWRAGSLGAGLGASADFEARWDRGSVPAHLIGNGRYSVLITADGAGCSTWRRLALTTARRDPVLADDGFAILLESTAGDGARWQFHADRHDPASREVEFAAHAARISVHRDELLAELEVCVALDPANLDAELRVVRVTERGGRRRSLRITGYAELALSDPRAHARHPAFSKLFVQSQVIVEPRLIVCRRRPREPDEASLWFGCALVSDTVAWTRYELDRAACLGRAHGDQPHAFGIGEGPRLRPFPDANTPMLATLDPCAALGGELELGPYETRECAFVLFAARSRAELLDHAAQLSSMAMVRRTLAAADAGAQVRAEEHGETTERLARFQRVLSAVLFPRRRLRDRLVRAATNPASPGLDARDRLGQPGLWRHGISGDWPLLVVRVGAVGLSTVTELIHAHAHWRARGLAIDLILLEDQAIGYGGDLRQRLVQVVERERAPLNANDGGVFLVPAAGLGEPERALLLQAATVIIDADADDLDALELELRARVAPLPRFEPEGQVWAPTPELLRPTDLDLDNGLGGFTADGREYVIQLEPGRATPAPWVNVLANPEFGCVVSERGSGYTWSGNAGLHRLTAWSNDAVLDPPSESLYLRDELDGEVWSPLPVGSSVGSPTGSPTSSPASSAAPYQVRHTAGATRFLHHRHGLIQTVELFVDPRDPVKFIQLSLTDVWHRRRRLTVTLCVEWLLGGQRPDDARLLTTDFEPIDEVALASNPWNPSFAGTWAFAAASERLHGMTGSREEFFGRAGSRARPTALGRIGLSGEVSHGPDACAALQVHVDLEPGGTTELHFVIGASQDRGPAVALAKRCRSKTYAAERRRVLTAEWDRILGAVEVRTPDPSFDILCNRWLLYQCVGSRLWGRTGFYQSSGAFGFRDQLQDVLALTHAAPERIRAHLLDAASHQYEAGDVQHWWHPPTGQGLRSRCSDDLLWLPLVTAAYVQATGDVGVLAERARFLDQPALAPSEHERYESEPRWGRDGTLYEHCMLALDRGRTSGVHDLPLIGSGDWNDGFSRVGIAGRGESVWLGWFYATVAREFAQVAQRVGYSADAERLRQAANSLVEPLERAWDGAWYRRAYTDEGEVIGGEQSPACKIDSLAQSWAVIARVGEPARVRQAMDSVWQRLVMADAKLVRLFSPAFARARPRLGYIEAYPPGVRENGGQYTHAAIWVAWAFSELGEHDRAHALWSMAMPTAHADSPDAVARYRVEPYAIAADIYAEPPHVGRGGWTWYTGAAGWAYRMAIERVLGLTRVDGRLRLDPCRIPSGWAGFELIVRDGGRDRGVVRRIRVERRTTRGGPVLLDGVAQTPPFELPDSVPDGATLVISIPPASPDSGG